MLWGAKREDGCELPRNKGVKTAGEVSGTNVEEADVVGVAAFAEITDPFPVCNSAALTGRAFSSLIWFESASDFELQPPEIEDIVERFAW